MQASKTATEASSAMALPEVLGVLGERLHRGLLGLNPRLQRQYVLDLRAAVLADISERQVADIHAMYDQRPGDSQNVSRVVRTEFLILGEDGDTFSLKKMAERSLEQGCGFRRQPDDLILARLAADPELDLVALAEL